MFKSHLDVSAAISLLKELVKIDSVNPSLVVGAKGESEIAEYLAQWLRGLGIGAQVEEVAPGRCNVVGTHRGSGGGSSLLLNGHMDTVGYEYMSIPPLDPTTKGGSLFGRGSMDMKGGLVSILAAVKSIVDSGTRLKGDVIIAGVCDEEYASIGTERLMDSIRADAAIVGEPTDRQILRCHKGFAWVDIQSHGKAAHGSAWDTGVDAIAKMGRVLTGLEELGETYASNSHPLVGPASIHASIIRGGLELSTYPDRCLLQIERRLIPGEDLEDVQEETEKLLRKVAGADPRFAATYDVTFFRAPMEVPEEEGICRTLRSCAEEVLSVPARFIGGGGWLDTQIIWERGIPAVAYGPEGGGAHSAVEWVDLNSVMDVARVLERTICQFCGFK